MTDGLETKVEGLTPAAARMRRYRKRRREYAYFDRALIERRDP
jgi:hypothetical protein